MKATESRKLRDEVTAMPKAGPCPPLRFGRRAPQVEKH